MKGFIEVREKTNDGSLESILINVSQISIVKTAYNKKYGEIHVRYATYGSIVYPVESYSEIIEKIKEASK